jgi:two-component system, NtrC family, nitrogen regulation response regulator NtrX
MIMKTDTHLLKILIIDDEIEISHLLTRFLERKGFAVQSAGNIRGGKDLYQQQPYRYLILDINLPDGNGMELLPYFKSIQPYCDIIMVSAMASPQLQMQSRQLGALTMLGKPFSTQHILTLIESGHPNRS